MQDIWKLKKNIAFGQGLFTLTYKIITYGDFYMGSKRSKSDYLSVSGQFVTWLTLCIVCLMYSTRVLYSFDSGGSLLSTLLGQGDLFQLIAVVNGTNDGSTVKTFVLGFGR